MQLHRLRSSDGMEAIKPLLLCGIEDELDLLLFRGTAATCWKERRSGESTGQTEHHKTQRVQTLQEGRNHEFLAYSFSGTVSSTHSASGTLKLPAWRLCHCRLQTWTRSSLRF